MKQTRPIYIFILYLSLLAKFAAAQQGNPKSVTHTLQIIHPGKSLKDPVSCSLVEVKDTNGLPDHYYTNVESVICGDNVCKIVSVRLFWDKFGNYTRFEVEPDAGLEKNEGEPFNAADYKKLHAILLDKKSPLKNLYEGELTQSASGNTELSGITGATVNIDRNAIVEGAVWTCYTLWFWANGELVPQMRAITAKQYSNDLLVNLLDADAPVQIVFAVDELQARKHFPPLVIDKVVQKTIEFPQVLPHALGLLEEASPDIYWPAIKAILQGVKAADRISVLNSVALSKQQTNSQFAQWLFDTFKMDASYQEVQLILRLSENKFKLPELSKQYALSLLNHHNVLVGRLAYWHLLNADLSDPEKTKVEAFKKAHQDIL